MKHKLVSAIITTHNRKDLLKRAIDSVFLQNYSNIELIVVDDASDDGTSGVCNDKRIKYIFIPKSESHGGNYARNLGIKASQGEYCAFLDDDDYWLPEKIEKQVELIEKMNCGLVYCGRRKEILKDSGVVFQELLPHSSCCGVLKRKILSTIVTTTSCILAKRQALVDVGMFDEDLFFWQEYELTIRLAQRTPFYYVNEPLTIYRVDTRDTQRLTNKYYEWKKAVKYIHDKHADLYRQLNFIEYYEVMNLVWVDAYKRCKSSGLKGHYYLYYMASLPYRVLQKLKQILF